MRFCAQLPIFPLVLVLGCTASDEETAGEADGNANTTDAGGAEDGSGGGAGPDDGGADGGGGAGVTSAGPGDGSGAEDVGGTAGVDDGDDDDGGGFVVPTDSAIANECDPKDQDCAEGQKCTAWANDGGNLWNANRCVDATGVGVGGDECRIEGSGVSGIDDCDVGLICMNTNEEGVGTCIKFCEGMDEDCDSGDVCAIYNDGVLPICLTECNPLIQNCAEGQSCIDTPNQQFICFNDASGSSGAVGDPCPASDGENTCDPGMWCGPGLADCQSVNCCTPYCELDNPDCDSPNDCVSFFGEGDAPPGLEDVGVCVLP